jgi:hypothetical protein
VPLVSTPSRALGANAGGLAGPDKTLDADKWVWALDYATSMKQLKLPVCVLRPDASWQDAAKRGYLHSFSTTLSQHRCVGCAAAMITLASA